MREQRRHITLSDLILVARDFEPHVDLDIAQLSAELVLLRVLAEPSTRKIHEFLSNKLKSEDGGGKRTEGTTSH